ncbi:MAG: hypothetical protein IPJ04_02515 [Candidatus Eisenbacteria bacterium]|nr:hypothetical protein [Candidatus Eisenbacteria bacterium]
MRPTRHHADHASPAPARPTLAWLALPALVALALKLWALARLLATPLAELREADAEAYWRWSGALLESGGRGDAPFFLGPLYPYVLALVRVFAGHSVAIVLALQCVAGAIAVLLLTLAAHRLAGRAVAIVVGLMLAANASWTFFDLLVLSESLQLALGSALLAVMVLWNWEARVRARERLARRARSSGSSRSGGRARRCCCSRSSRCSPRGCRGARSPARRSRPCSRSPRAPRPRRGTTRA